MSPKRAPDPAAIDSILDIVRNATSPVFVHCTAGDHRTGTVCALYRIRVQGWSQKRAWDEQEAFGFGPQERHAELFRFVYGDSSGLK
jgi:tyrosine-protein phosphatase SIW14